MAAHPIVGTNHVKLHDVFRTFVCMFLYFMCVFSDRGGSLLAKSVALLFDTPLRGHFARVRGGHGPPSGCAPPTGPAGACGALRSPAPRRPPTLRARPHQRPTAPAALAEAHFKFRFCVSVSVSDSVSVYSRLLCQYPDRNSYSTCGVARQSRPRGTRATKHEEPAARPRR